MLCVTMSLVNFCRDSLSRVDIVGICSGCARYVNSSAADIQDDFPIGIASFSFGTVFIRNIVQCNPRLRFIFSKIPFDLNQMVSNRGGTTFQYHLYPHHEQGHNIVKTQNLRIVV